jgi:hypothetical protein
VEEPVFFNFELYFADPSCILNGQDIYMSCLDGLVQTHHILNGQDVYMSCLDGLVQTHHILNGQDVYKSCLDGLV